MACLLLPSVLLKLESEEKLLGCPLMSCLFSLPLGGGFEYVNCCYLVSGAVRSFFCGISLCFMNILWEAIFARCLPKASEYYHTPLYLQIDTVFFCIKMCLEICFDRTSTDWGNHKDRSHFVQNFVCTHSYWQVLPNYNFSCSL